MRPERVGTVKRPFWAFRYAVIPPSRSLFTLQEGRVLRQDWWGITLDVGVKMIDIDKHSFFQPPEGIGWIAIAAAFVVFRDSAGEFCRPFNISYFSFLVNQAAQASPL
eukprot:Nitzschia sp. Nitz4//scaffold204_size40132//1429//2238//NITZ4_007535-RA/size40132-processed-gene-0.8-mRNA-1//1//CDS//3329541452//9050//frame0